MKKLGLRWGMEGVELGERAGEGEVLVEGDPNMVERSSVIGVGGNVVVVRCFCGVKYRRNWRRNPVGWMGWRAPPLASETEWLSGVQGVHTRPSRQLRKYMSLYSQNC